MERELWRRIVGAIKRLPRTRPRNAAYADPQIMAVYLWSVLHDRPVNWACDRRNWPMQAWRRSLPDQSTMSRRLAHAQTRALLEMLLDQLAPLERDALVLRIDGKPLPVAKHSQDRRAAFGRGSGGFQKGYKLHAIYAQSNRPVAYRVAPLNVDERVVAKQMLQEHELGEGYLLADANYETNPLYDQAAAIGRVLVTPRRFRDAKNLGQSRIHSTHRVAMIQRMKDPSPFIRRLLHTRRAIETRYANLTNFAGGLTHLPPWVRGRRVEPYVTAKILIRIARDHAGASAHAA
jgi:hypothetical protein